MRSTGQVDCSGPYVINHSFHSNINSDDVEVCNCRANLKPEPCVHHKSAGVFNESVLIFEIRIKVFDFEIFPLDTPRVQEIYKFEVCYLKSLSNHAVFAAARPGRSSTLIHPGWRSSKALYASIALTSGSRWVRTC